MENSQSFSKQIREKQRKLDEEKESIENYLKGPKWEKFLKLLHPKIRRRLKELTQKQQELNQYVQENFDLIQIEALEESKGRYGWDLLLIEKELEYLKNLENMINNELSSSAVEIINTNLKRKYRTTLNDISVVTNYLVHLALKYDVGLVDRQKAENLLYQFVYVAPYYEWGLKYNRKFLIETLQEKINQEKEYLTQKILEIEKYLNL